MLINEMHLYYISGLQLYYDPLDTKEMVANALVGCCKRMGWSW
jgi:hypothetical protein